jgi:chorismate-pyruvate lyase
MIPALLCQAGAVAAHDAGPVPADYAARLRALALLESLNADLLSHDSATATLDRWCVAHRMAAAPGIRVERLHGPDKAMTPEQRALLGAAPGEPIRYRHVRLMCGTHILSEADNWYRPGRLTQAMNAALDGSDVPFGRVVKDLQFRRQTVNAELLWHPLPVGWEMAGSPSAALYEPMPRALLRHDAVLHLPDGTPFSVLQETYTDGVLDF